MKKCQKLRIGCFYPVSIISLSSAYLRLISKTEIGIKKRPIIKIPLCCKDTKNMENVAKTCVCAFFFVPLHAKCAKRISTTHGKTDTHSHHHHRSVCSTAVHTYHNTEKWEVQQRTHLAKQANETRPHSLCHFAR